MKKPKGNDRSLESYKIFPYVAWGITLFFAFFVYRITTQLQEAVQDLQVQTQFLQERVSMPAEQIENFNKPTTTKKINS